MSNFPENKFEQSAVIENNLESTQNINNINVFRKRKFLLIFTAGFFSGILFLLIITNLILPLDQKDYSHTIQETQRASNDLNNMPSDERSAIQTQQSEEYSEERSQEHSEDEGKFLFRRLILTFNGKRYGGEYSVKEKEDGGYIGYWTDKELSYPKGWVVNKSIHNWMRGYFGFIPLQLYSIKKDDYEISIGELMSGVSYCQFNIEPVILTNKEHNAHLGTLVRADLNDLTSPFITEADGYYEIFVCSLSEEEQSLIQAEESSGFEEKYESITNAGKIIYKIPKEYELRIVEEMDEIIKSMDILELTDNFCQRDYDRPGTILN